MNGFPSLVDRMKRVIHFEGVSERDLLAIIRAGRFMRYSAEHIIFMEEDPCFGLCVLLRGEVHLCKLGQKGQESLISIIKPIIMFNEVAVLDGGSNAMTAIASKNSVIWKTDYETCQYGLERFPQLGTGLLPILAKRNRDLITKYANLSFLQVRERVAVLLLDLSDNGQQTIKREENTIRLMAAHIATGPVVVSRTLGELKDEGYIECTRAFIILRQPNRLAEIALLDMELMQV